MDFVLLKLVGGEPPGFRPVVLVRLSSIVALEAPTASRNCGCKVHLASGRVFDTETAWDDLAKQLGAEAP